MSAKREHHAAIRARAERAILDLYHNATPSYPRGDWGDDFESWFESAAEFEIDYLRSGGAYGNNPGRTFDHAAERKFTSYAVRRRYVAHLRRQMAEERARCNRLDSRKHLTNALWEEISDYGDLHQWGRGGRTLAPSDLVVQRGGSAFSLNVGYLDDMATHEIVRLIQVVESFNRYVSAWCRSVPEMWVEEVAERDAAEAEEADAEMTEAARALEMSRPDMYA